jgi:hypothetical protein
MPVAWQEEFDDASKTMHNSALVEIQNYIREVILGSKLISGYIFVSLPH